MSGIHYISKIIWSWSGKYFLCGWTNISFIFYAGTCHTHKLLQSIWLFGKSSMRKEVFEWFTVSCCQGKLDTFTGGLGRLASDWEYQVLPASAPSHQWQSHALAMARQTEDRSSSIISPRHLTLDSCGELVVANFLASHWLKGTNRAFWLAENHNWVLPRDWTVVRGNHGQGRVVLDYWAWPINRCIR